MLGSPALAHVVRFQPAGDVGKAAQLVQLFHGHLGCAFILEGNASPGKWFLKEKFLIASHGILLYL